jgi:hypothetical protein
MNKSRDPNRLIHAFLSEGEEQLQDQVYDAVRAEIENKRQRAFLGPWRTPTMNRFLSIGLGAAAVVVIGLFLGYQLLGSPTSNLGGPGVTPSPTAELTATPEPSTPEPSVATEGLLPEGPHVLTDGGSIDGMPTLPITVIIPAPDWYEPGAAILTKDDNSDAPDGAGMIVFFGDLYAYGDPCEWSTTRPETPATNVDELVAALSAQASRDASEPVDITLDGYAGTAITLHVPDDAVFSECDQGLFGSWGVPGPDESPFRYHQDPGQIDEVWILDVDGELAIIDWTYYEGTPQVVVDELRAIVESVTFELP